MGWPGPLGARSDEAEGLTRRQESALGRLRSLPTPAAPPLKPERLFNAPWWYRSYPVGALGAVGLLVTFLILPFVQVQETWEGPVALTSGSVVKLTDEVSQIYRLAQGQGRLILQGPAELQVQRLSRSWLTGRREGKLLLESGELFFQGKSGIPRLIQIQTPLLAVRVTGTRFLIRHTPAQGSRILVLDGSVQVKPRSGTGVWERLMSGRELKVTPDRVVLRNSIQNQELAIEGLRLVVPGAQGQPPALGRRGAPAADIPRYLWHEEE